MHVIPQNVSEHLQKHSVDNVCLHKALEYKELPELLKQFDVGLILYNGAIDNYIYNAPNKLFEYLACGLDVWLPNVMTGSLEYVCETAKPRVLALNFNHLVQYKLSDLIGKDNLPFREINHTCETEYEKLYKAIVSEY